MSSSFFKKLQSSIFDVEFGMSPHLMCNTVLNSLPHNNTSLQSKSSTIHLIIPHITTKTGMMLLMNFPNFPNLQRVPSSTVLIVLG